MRIIGMTLVEATPRKKLIRARVKLGLTQEQLGKKIGVHESFVNRVEMARRDPSFLVARRWLNVLGQGARLHLFAVPPQPTIGDGYRGGGRGRRAIRPNAAEAAE